MQPSHEALPETRVASRLLPPGQSLLIDADDTLWENSLYFEEAIARYISFLDHRVHTPEQVREHLNRTERLTIAAHGYGLKSFHSSLTRCLEELLEVQATPAQHLEIARCVAYIGDHAIELLHGVEATLRTLSSRHQLLLVTKGNPDEQRDKLARSGLAKLFTAVEVLREKDESAYRELADRHQLQRDRSWMIGNSPRSDINPALAAGLNAVLIPHAFTWVLEHEPVTSVPSGQTLVQVGTFADLLQIF